MFSTGKILFLAFLDMCRLIKRPQDIPVSINLLTICIIIYAFLSIFLTSFFYPVEKSILVSIVEILLIMLFTLALLQIRGKSSRWTQTMTALIGTSVIINIITIPIYFLINIGGLSDLQSNTGQSVGLLLLALLGCWNIVIMSHILRHALEINFAIAMFLAIVYIWIIFSFTS